MAWVHYVAYVFGGLFLTNSIPHLVCGLQGRPFQTPFARPRGVGLSSSTANVAWGWFNLAMAYLLLGRVGSFELRDPAQVLVAAVPSVLGSLWMARRFGRFHGGNEPARARRDGG
jgi:hypothetical protein